MPHITEETGRQILEEMKAIRIDLQRFIVFREWFKGSSSSGIAIASRFYPETIAEINDVQKQVVTESESVSPEETWSAGLLQYLAEQGNPVPPVSEQT